MTFIGTLEAQELHHLSRSTHNKFGTDYCLDLTSDAFRQVCGILVPGRYGVS